MKSFVTCKPTHILILAAAGILFLADCSYGYDPRPIDVGVECHDVEAIYHLTSNIQKGSWVIDDLYAVPVGIQSPEQWDLSQLFHEQFVIELQDTDTPEAYAQACLAVWRTFFSEDVNVLVSVKRTISATDTSLQCVSGTWTPSSTHTFEYTDSSDWLTLGSFQIAQSTVADVQNSIQNLLDELNGQPGAASDPQ